MSTDSERRDQPTRAARDRLAAMIGVHPRQLGVLSRDLADRISSRLNVLNRLLQKLTDQGSIDEMTGALRRAPGMAAMEREVSRARRFGERPLVVAFIDLDHLKAVNDTLGHAAGDQVIREIASTLRHRLRVYDLVIRWGGDEFVCVLPETGLGDAAGVLESVREEFASNQGQTFSMGFAQIEPLESASDLVARADRDLYERRSRTRGNDYFGETASFQG